jgi:hypothetical protein
MQVDDAMGKRAIRSIALLTMFLVLSVSFFGCAKAELSVSGWFSEVIGSPVAGEIINGTSVNLNFSIKHVEVNGVGGLTIQSIAYSVYVDGKLFRGENQTISTYEVNEKLILTNLTQGKHTLKVDVGLSAYCVPAVPIDPFNVSDNESAQVNFYFYPRVEPRVYISGLDLSRTKQTTFNITTNEYAIVSYSLDGAANVTLLQNTSALLQDLYAYNVTLLGLSEGNHILTAFVKDAFNQTGVAQKTFTVQTPNSISMEDIAAAIAIAVIIAMCAASIMLYRKTAKTSKPNA